MDMTAREWSMSHHSTDSANIIWWGGRAGFTSTTPLLFSLMSCADRDVGEQQLSLSYSSWSDAVDSVLWIRSRVVWTASADCSSPVASKSSSKYSGLLTAVGDVVTTPSHSVSGKPSRPQSQMILIHMVWLMVVKTGSVAVVSECQFFSGFCPSRTKLISALPSFFWKNSWLVIIISVVYSSVMLKLAWTKFSQCTTMPAQL